MVACGWWSLANLAENSWKKKLITIFSSTYNKTVWFLRLTDATHYRPCSCHSPLFRENVKLPSLNQESTLPCTTRSHFWASRYCDQHKPLNKTKAGKPTNGQPLPPPFFSPLLPELAVEAWEGNRRADTGLSPGRPSNNDHMDHRGTVASVSSRAHASTCTVWSLACIC